MKNINPELNHLSDFKLIWNKMKKQCEKYLMRLLNMPNKKLCFCLISI